MKLIDVLQMIANGELEEGTKVKYNDELYEYIAGKGLFEECHQLIELNNYRALPKDMWLECLNDVVEIIPKVAEKQQKSSKIEELKYLGEDYSLHGVVGKLNEVIKHINKESDK